MIDAELILEMLLDGQTATDIAERCNCSRTTVYNELDKLVADGVISSVGDLPLGASVDMCPTAEVVNSLMLAVSEPAIDSVPGSTLMKRAVDLCSRYGILPPRAPNERYTRARWTGHAYRRVDYRDSGAHLRSIMVVGTLVPRREKAPWSRAVPSHRLVYIVGDDGEATWKAERGRVVNADVVSERIAHIVPKWNVRDVALAVAWVCESRVVF